MALRGDSADHVAYFEEHADILDGHLESFERARTCHDRMRELAKCKYYLGEIMGNVEWVEGVGRRDMELADRLSDLQASVSLAYDRFRKTCVRRR